MVSLKISHLINKHSAYEFNFVAVNILDPKRIRPSKQVIVIGKDAIFTCMIYQNEIIKWYFKSNPQPIENGSVLLIPKVSMGEQGVYECRGIDRFGLPIRARATLVGK